MKEYIVRRVIDVSEHIIQTGQTVRETAKIFKISKSTVHKDCAERLREVDGELYKQVKKILFYNLSQRHLRGGEATKKKYLTKRHKAL